MTFKHHQLWLKPSSCQGKNHHRHHSCPELSRPPWPCLAQDLQKPQGHCAGVCVPVSCSSHLVLPVCNVPNWPSSNSVGPYSLTEWLQTWFKRKKTHSGGTQVVTTFHFKEECGRQEPRVLIVLSREARADTKQQSSLCMIHWGLATCGSTLLNNESKQVSKQLPVLHLSRRTKGQLCRGTSIPGLTQAASRWCT